MDLLMYRSGADTDMFDPLQEPKDEPDVVLGDLPCNMNADSGDYDDLTDEVVRINGLWYRVHGNYAVLSAV